MFSSRLPLDREPNRLARAVTHARDAGRELIDLTVTNPTKVGIDYPCDALQGLASRAALVYTPQPLGIPEARAAVSRDYQRRGIAIDTARILLTASTSEAYSLLFKLLCGPGDAILVPIPSYPLLDHLTRLEDVHASPYQLEFHGRWGVDFDTVDKAWSKRVRAALAVSPNNPTGSICTSGELLDLATRCARSDAALILDEVFADYTLGGPRTSRPDEAWTRVALTFRLGGLSKSAGLPQVKLGWIAVDGPEPLVDDALERLELICDTYLSVSTPVQIAASELMTVGASIRERILRRITSNHTELCRQCRPYPSIEVLPVDAGWSAVLRVPFTRPEEDLALELIEQDGVLLQPGFFFDFPHEAFLVVSLLPEPATFAEGIRRTLERAIA